MKSEKYKAFFAHLRQFYSKIIPMKNLVYALAFLLFLTACGGEKKTESGAVENAKLNFYGEKITEDGALPAADLLAKVGSADSMQVKVKGKITECCQSKGCWMKVDLGNNQTMRVEFKDYGFFVPLNSSGKEVIFEGVVRKKELSEAERKHFAEDAGKSKEEVEKIKGAEKEVSFEASGVIIKGE
jgi:Domain of unknown function (DUF4920)